MKGIILAGGAAKRLYPISRVVSKQLLPVYDKPMVYYPLSVLMLAGIRNILIISTPDALPLFQQLLGDGSQIGLRFTYIAQQRPEGLAHAFIIGKEFIGNDSVCLILGDNIFYGYGLPGMLREAVVHEQGGFVFGYPVRDPQRYAIMEFDENGKVVNIEEKPEHPKSNYAIPGLYIYDNTVIDIAENIQPSMRGELEITDVNKVYLRRGKLRVKILGRGFAWLDTGTFEAMQQAASYVQAIQERQGTRVASIEEIAYRLGYISAGQLREMAEDMLQNDYGLYLQDIAKIR